VTKGGFKYDFDPRKDLPQFSLFAVCKQVCAEASTVYYGKNTFWSRGEFMIHNKFYGRLYYVVQPPYSSLVRLLHISLYWECYLDGPLADSINLIVSSVATTFPKVKHCKLNLSVFELSSLDVDQADLSLDYAAGKLEGLLCVTPPLPSWFHIRLDQLVRSNEAGQKWLPAWEEVKRRRNELDA
jgi:hypothetical protein